MLSHYRRIFFIFRVQKKPSSFMERIYGQKNSTFMASFGFFYNYRPSFFHTKLYPSIYNILFLQSIGLSSEYGGINWYISPFFWGSIFYYALLKCLPKPKVNVVIGIIVYFSYMININYCHGGFGRGPIYNFIDLGLLRVLAGLGLGYLLGEIISTFSGKKCLNKYPVIKMLLFSIFEIGLFIFILTYFLYSKIAYSNQFIIVIAFSFLLLCFINGSGILSKALNNKASAFLGKYAYSIYVMQQISFWILSKTLWKHTHFVMSHAYRCIVISVLFSLIIGIITYHCIERPATIFYRKHFSN